MRHISSHRTQYSTELWVKLLPMEWLWSMLNPTHLIFMYLIRFEFARTMHQRLFLFRIFILHRITKGPVVWNLDYPDVCSCIPRRRARVGGVSSLLQQGTSPSGPSHWHDGAKPHRPPTQTSRSWDGRCSPNYSSRDKGREGRLYTCCLLSLELLKLNLLNIHECHWSLLKPTHVFDKIWWTWKNHAARSTSEQVLHWSNAEQKSQSY